MKANRVTMADIAAKVGVSRIAVSMALRNHHRISLERRKKIQRVAREMGFVPDPFLSALAAHRQQRVPAKEHGVLAWINHWKEPKRLRQFKEFDLYWQGASAAAGKFGYRVDEIRWEPDCTPKRLEKILLARGIEGVLIPPHRELFDWGDFDWSKLSVVRFGLSVPKPDSNVVTADNYRARCWRPAERSGSKPGGECGASLNGPSASATSSAPSTTTSARSCRASRC